MIFVTVGTNEARFDRLLQAVASLEVDEKVLVQHGHSTPVLAPRVRPVEFLPYERMVETIRAARVVVTHAGVGTVMTALANGKRPIVVPRRKAFGEAVDDHQLQLGRRFAAAGLVTLVESPDGLAAALSSRQEAVSIVANGSSLAADLGRFLEETIGPPSAAATA